MWIKSHWIITFLCLISFQLKANLAEDTLYLTWKTSPHTTMTIQWINLPDSINNKIYYKINGDNNWKVKSSIYSPFPETSFYQIHQVELTNLTHSTTYTLKLDLSGQEYTFETCPEKLNQPLRFVVGGDMYHDDISYLKEISQQAAMFEPLFAVIGGDIAYASVDCFLSQKIERWIEWVKHWHATMVGKNKRLIPVIACVGNHDVTGEFNQTPDQAKIFSAFFPMPGKSIYNVLDFSDYLSLILLDSSHANPVEGRQTTWLSSILRERSFITHKFAVYHVPAYPSYREFRNKISRSIRKNWVPLFETMGVQTAFEHHDHAYKRTYPIIKDSINENGVVYLGDGAWGVKKPRVPKNKRSYLAQALAQKHFIGVVLEKNIQNYLSIDSKGMILDKYVRQLKN